MASDLPDCPMCGVKADPRFWAAGVMFCDGCWPDPNGGEWFKTRALHAIAAQARIAELEGLVAKRERALTEAHKVKDELYDACTRRLDETSAERDAARVQLASVRADERERCRRIVNAAMQSETIAVERDRAAGRAARAACREAAMGALDRVRAVLLDRATEDPA